MRCWKVLNGCRILSSCSKEVEEAEAEDEVAEDEEEEDAEADLAAA